MNPYYKTILRKKISNLIEIPINKLLTDLKFQKFRLDGNSTSEGQEAREYFHPDLPYYLILGKINEELPAVKRSDLLQNWKEGQIITLVQTKFHYYF